MPDTAREKRRGHACSVPLRDPTRAARCDSGAGATDVRYYFWSSTMHSAANVAERTLLRVFQLSGSSMPTLTVSGIPWLPRFIN